MSLTSEFQTELTLLKCSREQMSEGDFSEACAQSLSRLEVMVAGASGPLDAGHSLEIVRLLRESVAPPAMKQTLTRSVVLKSSSCTLPLTPVHTRSGRTTSPWQKCTSAEHLLPEKVWDVIEDPKQSYFTRVMTLAAWLLSVGLVHGDELSYVHMTNILWLASQKGLDDERLLVHGRDTLRITHDLKRTVRQHTKKVKLPHYGIISHYPANPEEFLQLYPDIFRRAYPEGDAKNYPGASRIDASLLGQLNANSPMRNSHHTINSQLDRKRNLIPYCHEGPLVKKRSILQGPQQQHLYLSNGTLMTLKENEEEVGEDQCPGLIIYHDQQQLSNSLVQRPLRSPSNGSLAVQKEKDHDIVNAAPDPKIESKTVDDMTAAILPGLSKPKKQAKKVNGVKEVKKDGPKKTQAEKVKQVKEVKKVKKAKKASTQCRLPWPGNPVPREPICWGDFKIYTDMKMQAYRVKRCGERKDRAKSFKKEKPMEAWKGVLDILNGKA